MLYYALLFRFYAWYGSSLCFTGFQTILPQN